MKTAIVLFAGAMITSAAFAETKDPRAEERYRMKYGRYTPAEEARQKAAKEAEAKNVTNYVAQACCRHLQHGTAFADRSAFNSRDNEERFRMKYGRNTRAAEARQRTAERDTAMHIRKCAELGRCSLVHVQKAPANTSVAAANVSDTEARFRAKYGRSAPGEEQRKTAKVIAKEERLLVAVADRVPCDAECCKHGE